MAYIFFDTTNDTVYNGITNLHKFARKFRINPTELTEVVRGRKASATQRVADTTIEWVGYKIPDIEDDN